MLQLPPIGYIDDKNQPEAMQYLSLLVEESFEEARAPIGLADEGVEIFGYGRTEDDETDPFVNEIQNAVITATDVQTKEPIQVTLEPVETGEPPKTYWAGPDEVAAALQIPEQYVTGAIDPETFQQGVPEPLPEQYAEQLKALAQPKEMFPALVPQPGNPVPIRPEWLVDVDDRLVADTYQSIFDVHWMRCDTDYWIGDNLLDTNVQGWAYGLYQFGDDEQKHRLTHLPLTQVHIDPTARDITEAAYAGFDMPFDADEAKRQYPHLQAEIDKASSDGTPNSIDGAVRRFGAAYDRNFRRKMVVFRVMWLRNQPMPLDKDEAVGLGILEEREVPDVSVEPDEQAEPYDPDAATDLAGAEPGVGDALPDEPEPMAGGDPTEPADGDADAGQLGVSPGSEGGAGDGGEGVADPGLGDPGSGDDLADVEATVAAEQLGADSTPSDENLSPEPVIPVVATRMACFLAGTDDEVMPEDPRWPARMALRQITQIANRIVDDRECELGDIPILHNQNIPMTGSRPWGMGEPYRLKDAQAALNRTITAMVTNADFFAHPMTVMSEYTNSRLPEEYKDGRAVPGMSLIIPDDIYRMTQGKVDTIVLPPAMNESHTFLAPYLQDLIQKESGNTEVLQGRANPQVKSGVGINLLQSAATSLIGFKSRRTGRMVRHLSKLMLHALVTRLETPDLARIVSKYPPHVLDAIRHRGLEIEWNVQVRVESGSSGSQMQKRQQAQIDRQNQAISLQTYREECGIDDRVEEQRMDAEAQKMARRQALLMPPAPAEGGEPGEQQPAA